MVAKCVRSRDSIPDTQHNKSIYTREMGYNV
jgi:hypothetical protein